MGADQSIPGMPSTNLKSQRDEDIPYTSYSISKPIDGDTPRHSPRMHLKSRGHSPSGREKDTSTTHNPLKHDIVVVAEGNSDTKYSDNELKKIEDIPVFLPIMKTSLNLPNMRDVDLLDKIDARQMLLLCVRYQEHLKHCAEATTFDQNALCVRIKEIDFAIQTLNNMLTERQKKYAKYAEQIQKVGEVSSVLTRVKMHVDELIPLMERLNSVLPPEEQLEPFVMKPPRP
ncbi:BLOC-1-related complex subunit 5-like isoform X2 [Tubulanus polymorphus]|uniref:BLOC-1-related complex subunit 5-like isoform X2 n=1 Tax=Tubulanus polymorphus TaxID=672921 RepID=UPI003DA3CE30